MKRTTVLLLATLLLTAHGGATGIVKQRMDAMVDIGRAMKTIRDSVDRSRPDAVRDAAARIAGHARQIPALFPAGSFHPPSEALPAIAADRAAFDALATKLAGAAEDLAADAGAPRAAAERLAETCTQCHKRFRLEKTR